MEADLVGFLQDLWNSWNVCRQGFPQQRNIGVCSIAQLLESYLQCQQRCKDGVVKDFLSWCMHLLVPFLFHDVTSLHPLSFHRNDFSTCIIIGKDSLIM